MSIQTRCPSCEAPYTLGESQRGKKVRCRKCSNTFVVGEENDATEAVASPKSAKIRKDALQTSPQPPPKTPPPRAKPSAVRRERDDDRDWDRDRDDDEREDDRPRSRVGAKKKSSPLPMILMIGGGLLLLFLLCGGAAVVGVYWWTSTTVKNGIDDVTQNIQNPPNDPFAPNGFPVVNPPVVNPPLFDDGTPQDVPDAIDRINRAKTADPQNKAADWLAKAKVIDAKQKQVAQLMEQLAANPNTHDAAFRALAQWAGPEDVPTLVRAVDNDRGLWDFGKAGGDAAATLVRLQAKEAAPVFAKRLETNAHEDAKKRLAELGSVAEDDVLKYLDDPNGEAHTDAQNLLALYGTKPEKIFEQAFADLRSPDSGYKRNAYEYLAKAPVIEARRADVCKALDTALNDNKAETRQQAALALKTWGTQADVPALIAELNRPDAFNPAYQACLDALVALKDERGADAVAAKLTNVFQREAAVKALADMGPVAEKAVAAYQNNNDLWVKDQVDRLLKGYGTKADVRLSAMIADLDAKDANQRKAACEYFENNPPAANDPNQKDVARGLEKLLDDRDVFGTVPNAAAAALGVWGDNDSGAALVRAMLKPNSSGPGRPNSNCWQSAVDALVKLKDERAVLPLLAATNDVFHKDAAVKALNDMGPVVVETTLDEGLGDPTATVQEKIVMCIYLKGIYGTEASLPALQTLAMDPNPQVKGAAIVAIKAINMRNP